MRRWLTIAGAFLATAVILTAVTVNGSLQVLGTLTAAIVDFSGAASTAPMKTGTALPASCSVGQAFFKTDAAAGQNIYLCTAANTWTQVQGSGGGTMDWKPNSRYVSMVADFAGVSWNMASWYEGGFSFGRSGTNNFNNPSGGNGDFLDAGYLGFSTTATANNIIRVTSTFMYQAPSASSGTLYGRTNYPWDFRIRFRIPPSSTVTNTVFALALSTDSSSDPPGSAIGIKYVDGTDTNMMFYASGSAGVWGTTASSGVAPGTSWHTLRIRSDGVVQYKVWLSVDGGTEVDVCPSGCTLTLGSSWATASSPVVMAFLKTLDAVQKIMQLDYVSFWMDRGAER